jgi:ferrous iron transport protein A
MNAHRRRHHQSTHHPANQSALSDLPGGTTGVVCALNGGKELTSRLASLGVTPGTSILVVQNFGHGPVMFVVRDTRIALGRGEAHSVLVDPT